MPRLINASELEYFYKIIGKSIWHLQYVEDALIKMIFIKGIAKEKGAIKEAEANKILSKLNKFTLGQLIKRAIELQATSPELIEKLAALNKDRKWLVHNSWRESGEGLYTDSGRQYFFDRCEAFIDESLALQKAIQEDLMEYTVSKGVSPETLYGIAYKKLNKLMGEA